MTPQAFAFGDRVIHPAKPEWGTGEVVAAQNVTHNGVACQRLQVRFERAGLKTLSTAVAKLRAASTVAVPTPGETEQVPHEDLDESPVEVMSRVPEGAADPFTSLPHRFEATLNLYKYRPQGASLLDWAAMQSGLADPLERFNRHELEAFFERFRFNLDQHLGKIVRELRSQDAAALKRLAAAAPPAARDAVNRLHARG